MGSQVHIQSLVLICHNILMTSLPVWPPFSINYLGQMLGISQEMTKFKNYIFEGKHINSYLAKCNFTFCSTPRGQMTQDFYLFFPDPQGYRVCEPTLAWWPFTEQYFSVSSGVSETILLIFSAMAKLDWSFFRLKASKADKLSSILL